MSQKTLVNGTEYEITSGRTLVDGTGYDILQGRTLVGGTGYDILLRKIIAVYAWENNIQWIPWIYLYEADAHGNPGKLLNPKDIAKEFGFEHNVERAFSAKVYTYENGHSNFEYYENKEPLHTIMMTVASDYVDGDRIYNRIIGFPSADGGNATCTECNLGVALDARHMMVNNRIFFIIPPDGFKIHEHIDPDYPITSGKNWY